MASAGTSSGRPSSARRSARPARSCLGLCPVRRTRPEPRSDHLRELGARWGVVQSLREHRRRQPLAADHDARAALVVVPRSHRLGRPPRSRPVSSRRVPQHRRRQDVEPFRRARRQDRRVHGGWRKRRHLRDDLRRKVVPDDRRRRQLADGPHRPCLRRDRDRSERPGSQLRRRLGQSRRDPQERRPRAHVDRCRQGRPLDGDHVPGIRPHRPCDALRGNPRESALQEHEPGEDLASASAGLGNSSVSTSPSKRDVRTRSSPEPSGAGSSRPPTAASAGIEYRSAFPPRRRRGSRPSRRTRSIRTPFTSLPAGAVDASAPASS